MRGELREYEIRTFDALAAVWLAKGNHTAALPAARRVVDLAPFRESSYLRLMECHIAAGNNAEAVRVYGQVRSLLAETLGVSPSPDLESLFESALR